MNVREGDGGKIPGETVGRGTGRGLLQIAEIIAVYFTTMEYFLSFCRDGSTYPTLLEKYPRSSPSMYPELIQQFLIAAAWMLPWGDEKATRVFKRPKWMCKAGVYCPGNE